MAAKTTKNDAVEEAEDLTTELEDDELEEEAEDLADLDEEDLDEDEDERDEDEEDAVTAPPARRTAARTRSGASVKSRTATAKSRPAPAKRAKSGTSAARPVKPAKPTKRVVEVEDDEAMDGGLRGNRLLQMVLGLSIALILTIGACVFLWIKSSSLGSERDDRTAVQTRAAEFGIALLGYDYRNMQASRDRVLKIADGRIASTYTQGFGPGSAMEQLVNKLQASVKVTVKDIYITDVEGNTAQAIVTMDSVITTTQGVRPVTGQTMQFDLVFKKGEWKVTEAIHMGNSGTDNAGNLGTPGTQPSGQPTAQATPKATG